MLQVVVVVFVGAPRPSSINIMCMLPQPKQDVLCRFRCGSGRHHSLSQCAVNTKCPWRRLYAVGDSCHGCVWMRQNECWEVCGRGAECRFLRRRRFSQRCKQGAVDALCCERISMKCAWYSQSTTTIVTPFFIYLTHFDENHLCFALIDVGLSFTAMSSMFSPRPK